MASKAWDWKLYNVILLGLSFMMIFTAFQTTSMCSKLVTISLKREKILENSTELWSTYQERLADNQFMNQYDKNRLTIINDYREIHNSTETNLTNDEIIDYKIKEDIIDTQYGDGYLSMSLLYAVFAIGNFISAAVLKVCGHKITLVSDLL